MDEDTLSPPNRERLASLLESSKGQFTSERAAQHCATALSHQSAQELRDAALSTLAFIRVPSHEQEFTAREPLKTTLCNALEASVQIQSNGPDDYDWTYAAEACLAALHALSPKRLNDKEKLSIIAYTDATDFWTTGRAAHLASQLLQSSLQDEDVPAFIVDYVLQAFLRPIFSKATTTVTVAGRPAQFRDPSRPTRLAQDQQPWKKAGPHVPTIFQWAIYKADSKLMAAHWPLFIPVLITICEADELEIRVKGLKCLNGFLHTCPPKTLRSSGIDDVFEQTVFPSLFYLPSLTPAADSVKILDVAYTALITLALLDTNANETRRRKLLDKLLRDGILEAYFHTPEQVLVVEVLLTYTAKIVSALGILTVKHLSGLLQFFSGVMTDPFALKYPPVVLAATRALNCTLASCWPRLAHQEHLEQVIQIVSICSINLDDSMRLDQSQATLLNDAAKELSQAAKLLRAFCEDHKIDLPGHLGTVFEKEPSLRKLLVNPL